MPYQNTFTEGINSGNYQFQDKNGHAIFSSPSKMGTYGFISNVTLSFDVYDTTFNDLFFHGHKGINNGGFYCDWTIEELYGKKLHLNNNNGVNIYFKKQ